MKVMKEIYEYPVVSHYTALAMTERRDVPAAKSVDFGNARLVK